MAITSISITQNNIVDGSNLLPVHSPLVFLAEATYSGLTPDVIYVNIYNSDDDLLGTYRAIPYADPLSTVRTFMFDSGAFLRSLMAGFDDIFQINDSFNQVEDITKELKIEFYDSVESIYSAKTAFTAIHAFKQFGNSPNCSDVYLNEQKEYYCKKDNAVYVYFYNEIDGTNIEISKNGVFQIGTEINNVGLYRYKTKFSSDGAIRFVVDGLDVTHNITVVGCSDSKEIKYLDRNGFYRMYAFNKEIAINDSSSSLGTVNKTITNILSDQSDTLQVGYTNERTVALVDKIKTSHLDILSDIYTSPRLYYRIGENDANEDWLIVERSGGNRNVQVRNKLMQRFDLEIKLPTHYSTKMV